MSGANGSYYVLVNSKEWEGNSDVKAFCQLLLQRTLKDENKYQIGLSKIFFRAGMVALLESLRTARLNALVTLVQKNVRRRIAYKHYQDLRRRTITIQAWWRGIQARRLVEQMRRDAAATLLQRAARGVLQRRAYANTRQAVVTIQAGESSFTGWGLMTQASEDIKPVSDSGSSERSLLSSSCRVSSADSELSLVYLTDVQCCPVALPRGGPPNYCSPVAVEAEACGSGTQNSQG